MLFNWLEIKFFAEFNQLDRKFFTFKPNIFS